MLRISHRMVVIADASRQDKIANQRALSAQHWPMTSQLNWIAVTFSYSLQENAPPKQQIIRVTFELQVDARVCVCVRVTAEWVSTQAAVCPHCTCVRAGSSSCWPRRGIAQPPIMSFNVLFHLSQWGGAQQTPQGLKVKESNSAWKQITQCRQAGNYEDNHKSERRW